VILLSICIPTYNRYYVLEENILRCKAQIESINFKIELLVSDNASTDLTESTCSKFKNLQYFKYRRNESNIGPNLNFIKLVERASGKYVWILGDDDLICSNALYTICGVLEKYEPGLLVIHPSIEAKELDYSKSLYTEFCLNNFEIITHTSSCVVRRSTLDVERMKQDAWTFLTHFPQFIKSARYADVNVELHGRIIEDGLLGSENTGYGFFEVFATNIKYLLVRSYKEGDFTKGVLELLLEQFLFSALRSYYLINLRRTNRNFVNFSGMVNIITAFGVKRILKVLILTLKRKIRF
jgi:abequosyltransferase